MQTVGMSSACGNAVQPGQPIDVVTQVAIIFAPVGETATPVQLVEAQAFDLGIEIDRPTGKDIISGLIGLGTMLADQFGKP